MSALDHQEIWAAIDKLAARLGTSPSGLARIAGLDPTSFNKSKRVARNGKPRWPTTESLAKILEATQKTMGHFVSLMHDGSEGGVMQRIPVIG